MDLSQKKVELEERTFYSTPKMRGLCRDVIAEGTVLLENDGTLPIINKKISVFGRCQIDTFSVGYGSGGEVKAPYKINLIDGLLNNKANLNLELLEIYKNWCEDNVVDEGDWGNWPLCLKEMPLDENIIIDASKNSDVALFIIGRSAGEDRDIKMEKGSWYLTDEEKDLLYKLRRNFDKLCVIINSGSIMDVSEILEYKPNALMISWHGGQEMGNGLARVLLGKDIPSGKLPTTIAKINDYPSTAHFGYPDSNIYYEDIYVGYRYFNTFALDKVIYPFGYGLSYSKFNFTLIDLVQNNTKVKMKFEVKNIGSYLAKEVLEVYLSKPQKDLGNPSVELVAFHKTKRLYSNNFDVFEIEFDIKDFASYDESRNLFILESGLYRVLVGFDSRNTQRIFSFELEEEMIVKKTLEACAPIYPFDKMVNKYGNINYETVNVKTIDSKKRILNSLNYEGYLEPKFYHFDDVKNGTISLEQFVNSLDFEELETLTRGSLYSMNSPFGPNGNTGTFGASSDKLFARGIPAISTNDGPSGVRMACHSTLVPNGMTISSTFYPELIEMLAMEIGKEVVERNSHVMLAPGVNIVRNPLCGRNFEYFSEDPLVSGLIASAYIRGIQSVGASACVKHFACNNQEYLRYENDSILSQRALREIYLKPFEICIKNADPNVIMTSYNKINGEFAYYNYDLVKVILRNEFGFDGLVITDWWIRDADSPIFRDLKTQALRIRATVDVYMPGSRGDREHPGFSDGTLEYSYNKKALSLAEIRYCAKNVLAFCLKLK